MAYVTKKEVYCTNKKRKGKTRDRVRSHKNYAHLLRTMRRERKEEQHEELRNSLHALFHPTY